jgi:FAD:protein FMN transferase
MCHLSKSVRLLLGVSAALALMLASCRSDTPAFTARLPAFRGAVDVSIVGVNRGEAERARQALAEDFAFAQYAWSPHGPGPLRRVNDLLGEERPFAAPPSVLPLIKMAQAYADQSNNLFNPAIGDLLELWGFTSAALESHAPPDNGRIRRLVAANPTMADIQVEGIELRSDNAAVALDFRDFAVGYGIDVAMQHLRDLGIRNAMMSTGNVLRVIGDRAGRPWRISMRRANGSVVFAMIGMRGDESMATTTDYDRTFLFDGRTFHDNIDPRTGYPARETRSVTVIAASAAKATAAAQALFIAGPKEWQGVAGKMGIRYVLLIDRAGEIHMSPPMAARVELLDPGATVTSGDPGARPAGGAG